MATNNQQTDTRPSLSRDRILGGAVAVIDREGLDALSMRRLGSELGVGAMALYNYFPNKDALLEGVTEALLAEIDLSAGDHDDWAEAISGLARSFREVLLAHPNAFPLIESKPAVTPDAFRPIELSFAVLARAGFDPQTALQAHWAIVGYVIGHVSFQVNNPLHQPGHRQEEIAIRRANLPFEQFPRVFEVLPYMAHQSFDDAFDFGLKALIQGLKDELEARL